MSKPNGPRRVVCHWCGHPTRGHYVTPDPDTPGMSWRVCGPLCLKRPDGARVEAREGGRW